MICDQLGVSDWGKAVRTHKDLDVWKAAIALARNIYRLTEHFPADERFGLTAQMRRASVSIGSNVAEGAARQGNKEFIQFLYVASGSASELYTQLEIAKGLFPDRADELAGAQDDVEGVSRMLHGLIRAVRTRSRT